MLRYDRQTKPGLVDLYDIRPGNGAGLFLQPQSPIGAGTWEQFWPDALLATINDSYGYQWESVTLTTEPWLSRGCSFSQNKQNVHKILSLSIKQ